MLQFFFDGISYGFMLSFLIGPIFFALLQASIEKGTKIGVSVGAGVWLSDFLYILLAYFSLSWIQRVIKLPNFELIVGAIGAVVLVSFGIATLLNNKPVDDTQRIETAGYIPNFFKGFVINTINPFSIVFWVAMSSKIFATKAEPNEAFAFFSGILGVIILTDVIKVLLAKQISKYLTQKHILTFRKIVGIVLLIGGIVLVYRTAF